ncbi:hypothetical protein [Amycolatopsis rubida]|uniref:Phage terminase-like protein, large subunit, contains N-terminal HTH domain n=1 Tax=Amycolatopsis rubida TaxID=112413 RepID=A0A1I5IHC3_9PSEU|nr:hypothetical protein [Amycolatopsis rubida]SFO59957.1 Phage terminase-like protein, large subunit, contains N-terminal HTH domain [Amycolatopsis rubida]
MAAGPDPFVVDFPTLWVVPDWIEAHCPIPDGFRQGAPMQLYRWQLWCTVNHYRVRPEAEVGQKSTAFHYRRSQVVAPQKTGKGPWSATIVSNEAAGPALFAGWAGKDDGYACADHGCGCGWEYPYEQGEPMGMPWPTPLIQLLATSEDQVDNVYRPLQSMVRLGPLGDIMRVGEAFIRVGNSGRIDVVTSSAQSRLGNPITYAGQDETGLFTAQNRMIRTAETQRRGLAGMSGRSMETTNPPDPSEDTTAKRTMDSQRPDIFKYFPQAPANLSYRNKAERRKIHRIVYAGSDHVDLDAIEAEAAELMEKDPAQAERFFGNRMVSGSDAWMGVAPWAKRKAPREVPDGTRIVLGFDGSDVDDWTFIRAEVPEWGYQFTPRTTGGKTIWNPADHGGQVPRLEVKAAMTELFDRFDVIRGYYDPPYWDTEVDEWADEFGEKRVIRWYTRRPVQMHDACERLKGDVTKADSTFTHDGCEVTEAHVGHARAAVRPANRYVLVKPSANQKIDGCVTSVITHEAAGDVIAAGLAKKKRRKVIAM